MEAARPSWPHVLIPLSVTELEGGGSGASISQDLQTVLKEVVSTPGLGSSVIVLELPGKADKSDWKLVGDWVCKLYSWIASTAVVSTANIIPAVPRSNWVPLQMMPEGTSGVLIMTNGKRSDVEGSIELPWTTYGELEGELVPLSTDGGSVALPESAGGDDGEIRLLLGDRITCGDHVVVGGTFDRLHAGHRVLLAMTLLAARGEVYIGLTDDVLLVNKKHGRVLQRYEVREKGVIDFCKWIQGPVKTDIVRITDPRGTAGSVASLSVIVVTEETMKGAEAINAQRTENGLNLLKVLVAPIVADSSKPGDKLSSTALRAADLEAADQVE